MCSISTDAHTWPISATRSDGSALASRSCAARWSSRPMGTLVFRKMGRVFDPNQHRLPNDCTQFAQSPQALVLGDRIRVYFSTRAVDKDSGKLSSHIAYVH